ncbi:ATP-binding protein [Amycolatopsis pithecellobii]|uniref:AAA family ATPase n=1 Tax=Amycolatopsis pithecellobii TaxID=664692 RepID=A0A6N7Z9A2_9PSEU|nr:ATP-binding protein [Amycolatopsis pithecellobii]MTD58316.1 AAA family ATPase [Amycolatopsis pithecellobii]
MRPPLTSSRASKRGWLRERTTAGGVLLIGVEDDGRITGARPRHEGGRTDPLRLQALIASRTEPAITCQASVVTVTGAEVIAVEVPNSPHIVGTAAGKYVRRAIDRNGRPTCLPLRAHEMLAHEIDRGAVDLARLPAHGATWADLDPFEFERVRRLVADAGDQADRVLATLADEELTRALGLEVKAAQDLECRLVGGNMPAERGFTSEQQKTADTHLASRESTSTSSCGIQFGPFRIAIPTYSEVAFREVLANALTHRDYTKRGAIHVQWSDEQLEISSPGGFPEGIRIDNLLVAPPHPRSAVLADAFKRIGLVERTGRGINRMFAEQLRVGRPAPDYGRTTDETVVAILPGGPANLAMTKWVLEQEHHNRPLTLSELQILSELLRERRATTAELAILTQRTEAETRHLLTRMVERGWVEARGDGKGRTWHLSAAVYRTLDSSAGYVRVRGFEPLQQEQMILAFVSAHGHITRAQAADLCAIAPEQASRVLRRLAQAGKLRQRGQRKGTRYELPW